MAKLHSIRFRTLSSGWLVFSSRRRAQALLIWSMGLLFGCNLIAQTPSDAPSVTLRTSVRMVEVDVIARDKHGNPVIDLKPNDFVLFDNGHLESIARVSLVRGPQPEPQQPASESAKQAGPAIFTNTHPESSAPTVILLDLLNTAAEDQSAAKKGLLRSLSRLKEGTPVAMLILGDDLMVISDFTTSTISLALAADKGFHPRQEGFGPPISARATGNATRDAFVLKATAKAFGAENNDRLVRTVAALNTIAQQLSRIRGRKSLLWITGGLSVAAQSIPIEQAIDRLNDANVGVYTIDTRGVVLEPGISAATDNTDLTGPIQMEREEARGDVLPTVASATGGRSYRNSNRIDDAVTQAMQDHNAFYLLEYYPQHITWDGKPHRIVVKTSRSGVSLRHRASYLATPPSPPKREEQQQVLAEVESLPLDYAGIHFSVEMKPGQPGDPQFVVHVPANEVQWFSDGRNMVTQMQVWFVQKLASGEDLLTTRSDADMRLSAEDYQSAASQGVSVASDLKLESRATKVRVMVFDLNSGKIGTVDVPVASSAASAAPR